MHKLTKMLLILLILGNYAVSVPAIETAPRISDREIIESLALLKQGQIDINKRFDDVNRRFDDVNRRFNDFRNDVNKRFDEFRNDVNQRFNDVNQRLDALQNTMLVLFGAIITLIVALFGYIAWDRRTALKPLQERFEKLEHELHRDLEIQHEEGSLLTRIVKILRELAKNDKKVAELLRSFSL